ncbi:oligosaccharyl transferase stt3 subunit [Pichia californica]|uniref:dolichyl-diphosphooligosaccharide--protein glycotransferase n=1 Tax=Pichia californica TaxID=460514 RepID=A0A9P7BDZ2_9ASCO|nr:oligosaccharyl transferase stt3 subunit [[Candida] californica]KAG0686540.1 oligosaccharyl transferase stt3 subunit [[Candida] californica]
MIASIDNDGYIRMDASVLRVLKLLVLTSIFICISGAAIASRLFSVIRFESIIHEFDPWFNFRATKYLVTHSFYKFLNWFDDKTWYPLGRVTGGTLYPGLMVTSAVIHNILKKIGLPIDIRNICVMLAPAFSSLTALATYLFTLEITCTLPSMNNKKTPALLSAAFMSIVPGYISRSVAGSYDNEAIAITLLMVTFFLWIKSVRLGSILYASITAIFYFYMVSAWGGYVFITNMIPLHIFILILMGRFNYKLYTSYCTWYALGTLMSMQIPFVGFLPIKSNDHMAAFGVFGLLQLVVLTNYFKETLSPKRFFNLMIAFGILVFTFGISGLIIATKLGWIAPWTGRFYSLWDTNYAKIHIPIIASVSEHQPTPWSSFYFDLNFLIWLFPIGVYLCFNDLSNESIFIIVYSVLGSYFAGVMVRLMLTLAPVVCVCAAITIGKLFDLYLDFKIILSKKVYELNEKVINKNNNFWNLISRFSVILTFGFYLYFYVNHCIWVNSNAYSSPSVVLASKNRDGSNAIIDDFREAYYWLRMNTNEDANVMAWWDYGYQIGGMADRTTFVDNNTWNNTHIATVGKAMAVSEANSEVIMRRLGVDYVLIIFGGMLGYSGDDINKFLWMVRISEGIWPEDVNERSYFTDRGEYKVDDMATKTMKESLMYKMSFYNFGKLFGGRDVYDRVRQQRMSSDYANNIHLDVLEEVYTSENWLVRIYKLKDQDNFGRDLIEVGENERKDTTRRQKRTLTRNRPEFDIRV